MGLTLLPSRTVACDTIRTKFWEHCVRVDRDSISNKGGLRSATVAVDPPMVRAQLEKLLASAHLRNSRRSQDLLRFVVQAVLDGRADRDLVEVFRTAVPRARIILLHAERSGGRPDVFASGPRSSAPEIVMDLVQGALGSRLWKAPQARLGSVLCVDDDPAYLHSLARLLSRRGYQVSAFQDAERALAAIEWLHPELALVDIMPPIVTTHGIERSIWPRRITSMRPEAMIPRKEATWSCCRRYSGERKFEE